MTQDHPTSGDTPRPMSADIAATILAHWARGPQDAARVAQAPPCPQCGRTMSLLLPSDHPTQAAYWCTPCGLDVTRTVQSEAPHE